LIRLKNKICFLPSRNTPPGKDKHRLEEKGWKMIFQANGIQKQAGVAILLSNKADFF
jgi:hypothetical protein